MFLYKIIFFKKGTSSIPNCLKYFFLCSISNLFNINFGIKVLIKSNPQIITNTKKKFFRIKKFPLTNKIVFFFFAPFSFLII